MKHEEMIQGLGELVKKLHALEKLPDILMERPPEVLMEVIEAIREGWRLRLINTAQNVWSLSGPGCKAQWQGFVRPSELLRVVSIVSVKTGNKHPEKVVHALLVLSALYPDPGESSLM